MTLSRTVVEDLRARAERCLASAVPTPAEAHELAAVSLEVLARVEEMAEPTLTGGPYRGHRPAHQGEDAARAVSLERALEACHVRLHEALAKVALLEERFGRQGR